MDRKLNFGKYKGQPVKMIILTHIGYIMWCLENIKWFTLTEEEQELYDAIAIMVKRDNIETTFPKEPLYKHIKNTLALKQLRTPFFMHYGYIAFDTSSDVENDPILLSIKKYISKGGIPGVRLSDIHHCLEKDVMTAESDGWDKEDIYGGWEEFAYGNG